MTTDTTELDEDDELPGDVEAAMDVTVAGTQAERMLQGLTLNSRRAVIELITAIPVMLATKRIKAPEARAMLYAAQLALSALPPRRQTPRPARREVGFK